MLAKGFGDSQLYTSATIGFSGMTFALRALVVSRQHRGTAESYPSDTNVPIVQGQDRCQVDRVAGFIPFVSRFSCWPLLVANQLLSEPSLRPNLWAHLTGIASGLASHYVRRIAARDERPYVVKGRVTRSRKQGGWKAVLGEVALHVAMGAASVYICYRLETQDVRGSANRLAERAVQAVQRQLAR